jgi:hypothetical protein
MIATVNAPLIKSLYPAGFGAQSHRAKVLYAVLKPDLRNLTAHLT